MLSKKLGDGDEVAERFRHLLASQLKHAIVHPESREALARSTFTLRDLIFMVGEDQVITPAMNINLGSKPADGHCRALDVPARSPSRPGRFPGRFARFRRLPEGEV